MKNTNLLKIAVFILISTAFGTSCSTAESLLETNLELLAGSWQSTTTFTKDSEDPAQPQYQEKLTLNLNMEVVREEIYPDTTANTTQNGSFTIYANPTLSENFQGLVIFSFPEPDSEYNSERHYYFSFFNDELRLIDRYEKTKGNSYIKATR